MTPHSARTLRPASHRTQPSRCESLIRMQQSLQGLWLTFQREKYSDLEKRIENPGNGDHRDARIIGGRTRAGSREPLQALRDSRRGERGRRRRGRAPERSADRLRQSHQRLLPQGPAFESWTKTTSNRSARSTTTASSSRKSRASLTDSADVQRAELPRMPSERGHRRREPDRGAPHGPAGRVGRLLRIARRLADPLARDAPEIVERVAFEDDVRTFRISTNTLGAGFVEAVANEDAAERSATRNRPRCAARRSRCPCWKRASGVARYGRFGWKSQHASLESFAADAYLNEMGITTPLFPEENTSSGTLRRLRLAVRSRRADPEDDGIDVIAFADFMRSTKAPSRGPITREVHCRRSAVHAGGLRGVSRADDAHGARRARESTAVRSSCRAALGNKIIHPYSDFLLHDIGTGDGIPVLPEPEYAERRIRSARRRCGHCARATASCTTDCRSRSRRRSRGTPARRPRSRSGYDALSDAEQNKLLAFLDSL